MLLITTKTSDVVSTFHCFRKWQRHSGKSLLFLLAVACEVLARKIVHLSPPDRITSIMSTRFKYRQIDGDESDMSSALEMAIDQHWCVFD